MQLTLTDSVFVWSGDTPWWCLRAFTCHGKSWCIYSSIINISIYIYIYYIISASSYVYTNINFLQNKSCFKLFPTWLPLCLLLAEDTLHGCVVAGFCLFTLKTIKGKNWRYFKSTLLEPFCPSLHELIAEWDREAKILSQEEEFHGWNEQIGPNKTSIDEASPADDCRALGGGIFPIGHGCEISNEALDHPTAAWSVRKPIWMMSFLCFCVLVFGLGITARLRPFLLRRTKVRYGTIAIRWFREHVIFFWCPKVHCWHCWQQKLDARSKFWQICHRRRRSGWLLVHPQRNFGVCSESMQFWACQSGEAARRNQNISELFECHGFCGKGPSWSTCHGFFGSRVSSRLHAGCAVATTDPVAEGAPSKDQCSVTKLS